MEIETKKDKDFEQEINNFSGQLETAQPKGITATTSPLSDSHPHEIRITTGARSLSSTGSDVGPNILGLPGE